MTITKVGILPYHTPENDEARYLLYRPLPKYDFDEVLPYQLARGTVEAGEDVLTTAKREAEEELGIREADVIRWVDAGEMEYRSPDGKRYPIHWYLAEVKHETSTEPLPQDAAGLKWMTRKEVMAGMESGEIKATYREIFEVLGTKL